MFFLRSTFGVGPDGWSSNDRYPRELADVNGDGRDDIVGFGQFNVYVALASDVPGGFEAAQPAISTFTEGSYGWSSNDLYPRRLGDVNGDGRADIVGFGEYGVYTALGSSNGTFGPETTYASDRFGANTEAGGWYSNDFYPRELGDVNGDGRADIVGFGYAGVYTALGRPDGTFEPSNLVLEAFGPASNSDGDGWYSNEQTPREVADVNGDGRADIVGFGQDGVYVALGLANGTFGPTPFIASTEFDVNSGWSSKNLYPRELGDVNGDTFADIVGFGFDGVHTALGRSDGTFSPSQFVRADFAVGANGWVSNDLVPRGLGDFNGDGRDDIVAFGGSGVYAVPGLASGGFG